MSGNIAKDGQKLKEADRLASSEVAALLEDDDLIYQATQIFDALADYTRFQILGALSLSERSVGDLKEVCHVSQSAISHQLRLLRDRGLVTSRRDGQRSIYSIADDHVVTLIRVGLEHAGHTFREA
jgi:ArsR family transcriptional regulator